MFAWSEKEKSECTKKRNQTSQQDRRELPGLPSEGKNSTVIISENTANALPFSPFFATYPTPFSLPNCHIITSKTGQFHPSLRLINSLPLAISHHISESAKNSIKPAINY